jgi:hypothetical protein
MSKSLARPARRAFVAGDCSRAAQLDFYLPCGRTPGTEPDMGELLPVPVYDLMTWLAMNS